MLALVAWAGAAAMPQTEAMPQSESSLSIDGGARFTNRRSVALSIRLADPDFKPAVMALSSDGTTWLPWRPYVQTTTFELPDGDGEKAVQVRISESSGKEIPPLRATIMLDTTPPRAEVSAPKSVPGPRVTLTSQVPDAVAMQLSEGFDHWGAWQPYASSTELVLSAGEGRTFVHVRYRDEAGNVSNPAQVIVEVDSSVVQEDRPGVEKIEIVGATREGETVHVRVGITARGLTETEVRLDGAVLQARGEFSPTLDLTFQRTSSPRRIVATFWDASKAEYTAEVAFLEQELPLQVVAPVEAPTFEARIRAGFWMNGLSYDAVTPRGPRSLDSGGMGALQVSLALTLVDPIFVELSGEYASGKDASIRTMGVDVGVRFYRGPLLVGDGEARFQVGVLVSDLKVDIPDFGDFDMGTGFKVALSASTRITRHLSLDASLEFRSVTYDRSGTTLSGDREAKAAGPAALLGISVQF
jgi:hypothetical protein